MGLAREISLAADVEKFSRTIGKLSVTNAPIKMIGSNQVCISTREKSPAIFVEKFSLTNGRLNATHAPIETMQTQEDLHLLRQRPICK